MSKFPVVVEQPVAWGEMDAFGHVNNVVYYRYFENARIEYFRRIGWWELLETTGVGPIVASTSARYRRAVKYPDTLRVGARVADVGHDRFTMVHEIRSDALGGVTTEGEVVVVAFDYRGGAKVAIPEELRRAIEALER